MRQQILLLAAAIPFTAILSLAADSDDVNGLFRRDVNKIGAKRRW
jgi:hypothetical protein